jgi:hypothetical protein
MKKVLLTAFAMMASLSLMAQGTVAFMNDSSSKVLLNNGTTTVNAPQNLYSVALWWAPANSTDPAAFTMVTGSIVPMGRSGTFTGPNVQVDGQGNGPTLAFQVRGWQNTAGDYATAAASSTFAWGKSGIFNLKTGNPNAVPTPDPPASIVGAGLFTGLTMATVPEPSTIALGLLGLAGLFVLRRRS